VEKTRLEVTKETLDYEGAGTRTQFRAYPKKLKDFFFSGTAGRPQAVLAI
jgi:hypothetical protein